MKSVKNMPTVYLFVDRKNEATFCSEFIPIISQSLNTFVPAEIRNFRLFIPISNGIIKRMTSN